MIGRTSKFFLPIFTSLFLLGSLLASNAKASYEINQNENNFSFPSCESLIANPGDRAHYDTGTHQIVGGPLLEGSDDVYSLENGNFAQCFCPVTGAEGIQTNWLRAENPINGWFYEYGEQWNLGPNHFAAQNSSFMCEPQQPGVGGTQPLSSGGEGGAQAPQCPIDNKPQTIDQVWFSDITQTTIIIHWAVKGDATGYQLAYGIEDNKWLWGVKVDGGNVNAYQLKDLPQNAKIFVSVIPLNGNCSGNPSASYKAGVGTTVLAATGSSSSQALFLGGFSLISLGLWQAKNTLKRSKASK